MKHVLSLTMQNIKTYPCNSCEYIGVNRRMLAQHVAVAHSKRVFRCPLCPFITQYAANWYRHKRHLHGVSKFTTCEMCGFFASSPLDLTQHKEKEHPGYLPQVFGEPVYQEIPITESDDVYAFHLSPSRRPPQDIAENVANNNQPKLFRPYENITNSESVTFSLPLNGLLLDSDIALPATLPNFDDKSVVQETPTMMNSIAKNNNLKPLKIRRSYCCDMCQYLTGSPREFLYHQRDVHRIKMNIFECELCIYASKHIQKLQRHYGLVHRQQKSFDIPLLPVKQEPIENNSIVTKNNSKPSANPKFLPTDQSVLPQPLSSPVMQKASTAVKRVKPGLLKCTICSYQTRNKVLMAHHEKTVHFNKKFFKCNQCDYVTNEKAQYAKHIKYHNLSKMQCEFCPFKSAYKFNMDKHIRSHMQGSNGEYNCTLCNFVTHNKQSLKFHASEHEFESGNYEENGDLNEMEPSNEIISDQSGEMVVDDGDWMNMDTEEFENNELPSVNNENLEHSNMTWDSQQEGPQILQCNLCRFTTTWPFELKKHEDSHKSDKKHSCPICGMRFEHIAWLTKHLLRVHADDSEAQSLAAAYELIKPQRRRPASKQLSSQQNLENSQLMTKKTSASKQTLLSNYLKNPTPIQPISYSTPKEEEMKKPLKYSELDYKFPATSSSQKRRLQKQGNSCKVCNYKTKWASELDRHMRVHMEEKPFHCTLCNYSSKWKGDVNRHLTKYHGRKLPVVTKTGPLPKLKLKKTAPLRTITPNDWEAVSDDSLTQEQIREPRHSREESPLDLTIAKTAIFRPSLSRMNGLRKDIMTRGRRESTSSQSASNSHPSYLNTLLTSNKSESKSKSFSEGMSVKEHTRAGFKKKYFCPFCAFNTSTPSRFHVHIIQHYNRRPFMCSVCGHNSNWEWDITKHIRLKGCKDKDNNSACVLLTHESGRRNYEKYDKYLRETRSKAPCSSKISTPIKIQEDWQDHTNILKHSTSLNVSSASQEQQPEDIVVTPDLPFSQDAAPKSSEATLNSSDKNWNENDTDMQAGDSFKYFLCKHCNYKHSSKKVVISHLSVHAGVRPFRCRSCGLTSSWRNVIVQHIKSAHNGYMSDVEDRITYVQEGFVIRITSVKNAKFTGISSTNQKASYNCDLCPYKCDKEVYIKFHMKQHKPKEGAIYHCPVCPYYVKFKRTLVRHLKLHNSPDIQNSELNFPESSEKPEVALQNEIINSVYSTPASDYSYAMVENKPQANYIDDSLRISYDRLQSPEKTLDHSVPDSPPRKHKRLKLKKHMCENCPYRTDNRTAYLYHKQFHRPNPSAPFKCTVCTYWATMQHLITQHMRVHKNSVEESFEDETDPRNCSPSPERTSAVRNGLGKMYKCRFCPMTNKKKANVKVHEKMHAENENAGRISCHLCTYKCAGQGNLTNHLKLHHSSNQSSLENISFVNDSFSRKKVFSYFCALCPAVFKSSSDLFIHKTFHGSSLPFPCPHCDYRAKHRNHLQKHLQVHTDEYISKRDASYRSPGSPESDQEFDDTLTRPDSASSPDQNVKVDQMLLLELAEVNGFLRNTKVRGRTHKCHHCPTAFCKPAILAYHLTLHGSSGEFGCSQCNYATTRPANLTAHTQVHSKLVSPGKKVSRVFRCPNCPAVFEKGDRFERHLNLHGSNSRFACEYCDYSVGCAANLVKHRLVHEKVEHNAVSGSDDPDVDEGNKSEAISNEPVVQTEPAQEADQASSKALESLDDDRKAFVCERCPYFQMRKDQVIHHQNRHWQREGLPCLYCDYRVLGGTFLQNHVKSHITPTNVFSAHLFAKFIKFDISYKDGDKKVMLFDDKGPDNKISERFFPPLEDESILNCASSVTSNKNSVSETKDSSESPSSVTATNLNESNSSSLSASEPLDPEYLPKVVLTDIFSNSDPSEISSLLGKKTFKSKNKSDDKKCKSKTKTYSTSNSNNTKSSIIVKIKVENVVEDNNERSLYSISNGGSEHMESLNSSTVEDNPASDGEDDSDHESQSEVDQSNDASISTTTTALEHHDYETKYSCDNSDLQTKDQSNDSFKSQELSKCENIQNGVEEVHSSDILKELNSIVNGVCDEPMKV